MSRRVLPPSSAKVTVTWKLTGSRSRSSFSPVPPVLVHQPLGFHHLDEGDLVLVVAPVGPVHDEAPHAAGLHFHLAGRGRKSLWAPTIGRCARARSTPSTQARAARRRRASRGSRGRLRARRSYFLRPCWVSSAIRPARRSRVSLQPWFWPRPA